jgi:hypothetical protein
VEVAQQLGEIAVARLRRRGLEGAAQRGGYAGMGGRDLNLDDPAVDRIEFRCRNVSCLRLHLHSQRPNDGGSFVRTTFAAMTGP